MGFSDKQKRALAARLSHRHVKTRLSNGATISYVEGWHAVAEANRIFGYDSWDRNTIAPRCLWSKAEQGHVACFYTAKVRVTVRAGDTITIREGIGTGFARSASPELAHEIALKAAETDGTKRALATFGNPFGLALYDKTHARITKPSGSHATARVKAAEVASLHLFSEAGDPVSYDDPAAFASATLKVVDELESIDAVYAFWERNLASFTLLREQQQDHARDWIEVIVQALKARVRSLSSAGSEVASAISEQEAVANGKSLLLPKETRRRDKQHLAFVAKQPCLICGRQPSHAHHVRFAQPRALALKVSDEFTVPLCAVHHDALHREGNERAWWAKNRIPDPLIYAARLWSASRLGTPIPPGEGEGESQGADHKPVRRPRPIRRPREEGTMDQGSSRDESAWTPPQGYDDSVRRPHAIRPKRVELPISSDDNGDAAGTGEVS